MPSQRHSDKATIYVGCTGREGCVAESGRAAGMDLTVWIEHARAIKSLRGRTMIHTISAIDSHEEHPDVFPEGWTRMTCSCDWSSEHCSSIELARSEAATHLQSVTRRPRYTAGYRGDGSVDFEKALTRPIIGRWEFPDWEQK